eukprot:85577-Prymnesium_polylepis.1
MEGATPLGLDELVKRMDVFDWTDGIYVRQERQTKHNCKHTEQIGDCYPELQLGHGSKDSFGFNWTHPKSPPAKAWTYFTSDELGGPPDGFMSAAV